ncbi:MAG: hypothetical protein OHK93_002618 [Ramalina farinacea]|uniref:Protein kinase domain-containing protein n=1 Tax=Ramalina farinacea TaxID=258253 RepID=A0AA43QTI1_9LECA|nr:hypothetical protein [Ramalina farinacea]
MAELILAAVALGAAGPGIALKFAQCGRYLKSKVDHYQQAPDIVVKFGTFGHNLHSGQLNESLVLANWAYSQDDVEVGIKDALEDQIDHLKAGVVAVDQHLDKCFDERGVLKRSKFLWSGERKLKASMNELDQWQRSFWHTISLVEMRKRVLPDPSLLTSDKFQTSAQANGQLSQSTEPFSHARIAKGQISDMGLREIDVLIEPKRTVTSGVNEIKEIASYLSRLPARSTGILRCLGYRSEPQLELIFELPQGFTQLRTLDRLILDHMNSGDSRQESLDYRFSLACDIAEAVLSVHTSGRVHKNIRPDTILIIETQIEGSNFRKPYLTDWTMLRKTESPSTMVGEDDWLKDLYRHPRRHGLQPEQRYNMGHDIYSLGVNLLTVGLWEPLVNSLEGVRFPCEKYANTAVRLGLIQPEDLLPLKRPQGEDRESDIKRLVWTLTRPLTIQRTLQGLAEHELPSRMGLQFTRIVTSCLSCPEGGFGDVKIFEENNKQAIGVNFTEKVLQPLSAWVNLMEALS